MPKQAVPTRRRREKSTTLVEERGVGWQCRANQKGPRECTMQLGRQVRQRQRKVPVPVLELVPVLHDGAQDVLSGTTTTPRPQ
jgi:hypothetical protein